MREKLSWHHAAAVITVLLGAAIMVLAILQVFGIWDRAILAFMPLLVVRNLFRAALEWKDYRKGAYIYLGTAGFLLICTAVIWVMKF